MLVLPTVARVRTCAAVTAKLRIAGILLRGKYLDLRQVSLEMCAAYLGLEQADFVEGACQQLCGYGPGSKQLVEFSLLLDKRVTQD